MTESEKSVLNDEIINRMFWHQYLVGVGSSLFFLAGLLTAHETLNLMPTWALIAGLMISGFGLYVYLKYERTQINREMLNEPSDHSVLGDE